jgi:hypothetical protein
MDGTLVRTEITALKAELGDACDALLSAAQSGLKVSADMPVDGQTVGALFVEILALCAFHDLASQRLDRLTTLLSGGATDRRPDAGLLQGPANGDGLDQAAADALFAGR